MRIEILRVPSPAPRASEPSTSRVLLQAWRVAAERDAADIVQAARREADGIVEAARAEARRVASDARAAAFAQGVDEWTKAALALVSARAEAVASVEREALTLALEIARRIVGDLVEASPEAYVELVARACDSLRRDGTLVIRHARCDVERVAALRDRLRPFREIAFEMDPTLGSGDCLVECAGARVDARLDAQLATIGRLLLDTPAAERSQ